MIICWEESSFLRSDHRPLTTIFDSTKVTIPTITTSCLARWAQLLSQHDYQFEYQKSTNHGNADCPSRLLLVQDDDIDSSFDGEDKPESYIASIEMETLNSGPIHYHQLQKHTEKDHILHKVVSRYVCQDWPYKLKMLQ